MSEVDRRLFFLAMIGTCFTVLICIIFVALWKYKEIVAITLVALLTLSVLVGVAIAINEMVLRHRRYQFNQETPLKGPYGSRQETHTGPYHYPAQPYGNPAQYYHTGDAVPHG